MSQQRGYSVSVAGNHGQAPEIDYNAETKFWTINLRPRGPGKSIVHLGDEVVVRLLETRLSLMASGIIDAASPQDTVVQT